MTTTLESMHVQPPRLSVPALEVWNKSKKNLWSIVYTQSESGGTSWAYTVGLWENFGHPEVMISGLGHSVSVSILNVVGNHVKNGRKFTSGINKEHGILKGLPVKFYPLESHHMVSHLRMVSIFQPAWKTEGLELIWPDPLGNFFDEAKFNGKAASEQLFLIKRP